MNHSKEFVNSTTGVHCPHSNNGVHVGLYQTAIDNKKFDLGQIVRMKRYKSIKPIIHASDRKFKLVYRR